MTFAKSAWYNGVILSIQDETRERRKECDIKFRNLLDSLPLTVNTTWKEVQEIFVTTPLFQSDPHIKKAEKIDLLNVFEEHMTKLERQYQEEQNRKKDTVRRQYRVNREGFRVNDI